MIAAASPVRREAAAHGAGGTARADRKLLTIFRLGGEFLAVETSAVQEITLMARLSTPNGLPTISAGFLNLAQQSIPVIRLHKLLHLPEVKPGLYTQILILREADWSRFGWMVDQVTSIAQVRVEELMPVPENHCFRDCVKAVLTIDGAPVSVLAPDRVLLEQERRCILEFQTKEQERLSELEATVR